MKMTYMTYVNVLSFLSSPKSPPLRSSLLPSLLLSFILPGKLSLCVINAGLRSSQKSSSFSARISGVLLHALPHTAISDPRENAPWNYSVAVGGV